jgi:hypothetical protein
MAFRQRGKNRLNTMIPNIIHFIWPADKYKGSPFGLTHELAIRSAHVVNRPEKILFHCENAPTGQHWERVSNLVEVIPAKILTEFAGSRISTIAHRSDLMRLHILSEQGGIYLDNDTICVKPLGSLLEKRFVIGRQGVNDLCNAVILSEPNHEFLKLWLDGYKNYVSFRWGYNSCSVPTLIWRCFPWMIHAESEFSFHYPAHGDLDALFVHDLEIPGTYIFHLWSSHSWIPFLSKLTEERIRNEDTTYNRVARRFIERV